MRALALSTLVFLTACTDGGAVTVSGKNLINFFPFDGDERSWTFESDTETQHRLHGVRSAEPELIDDGGTEVWTITYDLVCVDENDTTCTESHYRTFRISADAGDGVLIHSIAEGEDAQVDFDPPVLIGDADTLAQEEWVTETTVGTVSATFTGSEDCAIRWTDNWDDCVVLEIDDGGANTGLNGTIWAVASWNMVAFQIGPDTGRWELSSATFE